MVIIPSLISSNAENCPVGLSFSTEPAGTFLLPLLLKGKQHGLCKVASLIADPFV